MCSCRSSLGDRKTDIAFLRVINSIEKNRARYTHIVESSHTWERGAGKNAVLDRASLSCLSHLLSVSDEAEVRLR